MIKVSVMYPNSASVEFDIDYYCNTHIPMVSELLGDALKGSAVEAGIAGGAPGEAAPFIAIGHLTFDSIEEFQQAFAPHAEKVMADVPNYTNSQPQLQISDVKL